MTGCASPRSLHCPTVLSQINKISARLTHFESLEATFPDVLAIASQILPLHSALIIEGRFGRRPSATIWHAPSADDQALATAKVHAQAAFAYLKGLSADETRQLQAEQILAKIPFVTAGLQSETRLNFQNLLV